MSFLKQICPSNYKMTHWLSTVVMPDVHLEGTWFETDFSVSSVLPCEYQEYQESILKIGHNHISLSSAQ
jgi:hypothetical protein